MPKKLTGTIDGVIADDGSFTGTIKGTASDIVTPVPPVPPPPPPPPTPVESASGTVISRGSSAVIRDASLSAWTLSIVVPTGQVKKDGVLAGYTANVKSLQYVGGVVSQTNDIGDTYEWKNNDWALKVVTPPSPPVPPPTPTGAMLKGINFSGLELYGAMNTQFIPGTQGPNWRPPTNQEIDYFAASGMKICRLPFLWERCVGGSDPDGALFEPYMKVIDAVVARANSKGMKVILDSHQFGRFYGAGKIIGESGPTATQFANYWVKLYQRYKNNTEVIFDLNNEPHDQNVDTLVSVYQIVVTALRNAGSKHMILLSGTNYDGAWGWVYWGSGKLLNVKDPINNLVYQVHMYGDGQGGFGKTVLPWTTLKPQIDEYTNWMKANKVRGFFGELGVPNSDPKSGAVLTSWLQYLEDNRDKGDGNGGFIGWTYYWAGSFEGIQTINLEPNFKTTPPTDAPLMDVVRKFL